MSPVFEQAMRPTPAITMAEETGTGAGQAVGFLEEGR
jgi:hypothetical protein